MLRCWITLLLVTVCVAGARRRAQVGGGQASSRAGTSQAASGADIEALIRQLGNADYARREAAQERLVAIGDAAVEPLMRYVEDPDWEVASRVAAIVAHTGDPKLRARVAVRLLETERPDRVKQAVRMLFQDAEAVVGRFRAAAVRSSEKVKRAAPVILKELDNFIFYVHGARRLIKHFEQTNPSQVAVQRENIEAQRRDLATYAYYEVLVKMLEDGAAPATRPAVSSRALGSDVR